MTRLSRAEGIQTPILFLNARDGVHDKLTGLSMGGDDLPNVRARTPPGTQTEVRLATHGDTETVIVADTGPGMTEDRAKRIFERFYRVDPSRSRRREGLDSG